MTRRCDSNPAQYERNRRFGHLVHALGRAAGGAKLPSVGLCLNASKAVSFLVKGGNDISRSLVSRQAQNNVTLLGGRSSWPIIALALIAARGRGSDLGISPGVGQASSGRSWVYPIVRCRDSESSVDDLGTWQGVVLGRAVTTLRSVETQPLAWGFVLSERRGSAFAALSSSSSSLACCTTHDDEARCCARVLLHIRVRQRASAASSFVAGDRVKTKTKTKTKKKKKKMKRKSFQGRRESSSYDDGSLWPFFF
ncbi:hypothetical protein TKK_0011704 [Trichogramma kaykai]